MKTKYMINDATLYQDDKDTIKLINKYINQLTN